MASHNALEELRLEIEALRRDRGFLLAHHGAMAVGAPELMEPYFSFYRALTLSQRHLSALEKEFVWLCILIVAEEAVGTHHIDLFFKAGGTQEQALLATQIGALAIGAPAYAFMDIHWSKEHFPMLAGKQAYLDTISRTAALTNPPSSSIALGLAAANASLGRNWGTAAAIEFAYANAVPEEHLLEALSLVIWPSGVNRFVDACETWQELMADGVVEPSERFRIWAETPDQKGFSDKASPD